MTKPSRKSLLEKACKNNKLAAFKFNGFEVYGYYQR